MITCTIPSSHVYLFSVGIFFLLAAAREGENVMKDFFMEKVETVSPEKKREAVMRFMVLWKVRYKVWPAIGERGQKRFNLAEERQVSSFSPLCTTTTSVCYL